MIGIELGYANLTGANLAGTNLTNANLTGANLTGANLTNANLTNANLTGVNLSDAILEYTDFSRAKLIDANLTNTWIRKANFCSANLSNADMREVKTLDTTGETDNFDLVYGFDEFTGQEWSNQIWLISNFSEAIFNNANLEFANLQGINNLTLEQVKTAKNWDKAVYSSNLYKELGLANTTSVNDIGV